MNRSVEQGSPLQKDTLRPNTGRQMVEPRNIELGGQKTSQNLNQSIQQLPIYPHVPTGPNRRPVVRFCDQSFSGVGMGMVGMRQREFSEKTIETK